MFTTYYTYVQVTEYYKNRMPLHLFYVTWFTYIRLFFVTTNVGISKMNEQLQSS